MGLVIFRVVIGDAGANNLLVMASGVNVGIRRSLPLLGDTDVVGIDF
ncbi:hypothetical protein [Shewanella fodinae]|uniref:Uncharacterized protein n=1 Tax=Shewanella fodinae TaxID=552357 RepID=A0A4R2FB71_9GAMM|nr:hypothetical protein [Shewanella fodinae]TCN84646.1 hypothetical protein EDC91_11160 [Shewanella fodinae]